MTMIGEGAFDGKTSDKSALQTSFEGKSTMSERDVDRIVGRMQSVFESDMPVEQLARLRDSLTRVIRETVVVNEADDRKSTRQSSRLSNDHTLQTEHEFMPIIAVVQEANVQAKFVHACCKGKHDAGETSHKHVGINRMASKDKKIDNSSKDKKTELTGKSKASQKYSKTKTLANKQTNDATETGRDNLQDLQLNESTVMRASNTNNQLLDEDGHQDIFEALDMMRKALLEPPTASATVTAGNKISLKSRRD